MKKLLLSVAFVAIGFATSFAQTQPQSTDFKPQAGQITFGTTLQSPFAAGAPFGLANNLLGMKYFLSSDMAFRVGLNYTVNSNKQDKSDSVWNSILTPTVKEWQDAYSKTSTSNLNLRLGLEKHFKGTDRLDPFAGADLIIGMGRNHDRDENYNAGTPAAEKNYICDYTRNTKTLGLALVIGADYYIFSKIYVGTEFGWKVSKMWTGEGTEEVSHDIIKAGAIENKTELPTITKKSSTTAAAAEITGAFRLGFRF